MEISRIETSPLSEKDIIDKFNVDTIRWELEKLEHWHRMAQQKDANGNPVLIDMYRTLAKLKLKHPLLEYEDIIRDVFSDIIPINNDKPVEREWDKLWLIFHADLHFDRLGIPKSYLNKIDTRTIEIANRMKDLWMDKLLYANIGDYFNSDHNRKTTKGTEQVDGMRGQESFKRWLHHQHELYQSLSQVAPTKAIYLPWNHDQFKLQYLSDAMALLLWKSIVDNTDSARKYERFWNNLIGLQHWHDVALKDLLNVVTQETKLNKFNYMYQGHLHQEIQKRFGPLLFECIGNEAPPSEREERKWFVWQSPIKWVMFDKKKWKFLELYW